MSWLRYANIAFLVYYIAKSNFWLDLHSFSPLVSKGSIQHHQDTTTSSGNGSGETTTPTDRYLSTGFNSAGIQDDEYHGGGDDMVNGDVSFDMMIDEDAWEAITSDAAAIESVQAINSIKDATLDASSLQATLNDAAQVPFKIDTTVVAPLGSKKKKKPPTKKATNTAATAKKAKATTAAKPKTTTTTKRPPTQKPTSNAPIQSPSSPSTENTAKRRNPNPRTPKIATRPPTDGSSSTSDAAASSSSSSSSSSFILKVKRPTPPPFSAIESSAKFAYVFFLGGVTATNTHHLGHIYNIMVSAQALKESGSTADMIVLVHTTQQNTTLPTNQQTMLEKLGIQIRYANSDHPIDLDPTIYFSAVPLEKFRIFGWTEYDRIMVLDADLMPHCNMDYLFHRSMDGTLQENVFISIGKLPISPNIFVTKPTKDAYYNFLKMLAHFPHVQNKWWQFPKGEWTSLYKRVVPQQPPKRQITLLPAPSGPREDWDFPGRDSDVGLLFAWMRYKVRSLSIIVGPQIYKARGSSKLLGPENNPLHHYTCQGPNNTATTTTNRSNQLTSQEHHVQRAAQYLSPESVGPYWDFAQWQHDKIKPWERPVPSGNGGGAGAVQRWFQVLTKLDQEHNFHLGLAASGGSGNDNDWTPVPRSTERRRSVVPSEGLFIPLTEEWAQKQVMVHLNRTDDTSATNTDRPTHIPPRGGRDKTEENRKKRAFVCVTGQLERLELDNKIEKLFQPILQQGFELDVALVLTGGTSIYTNDDQSKTTKNHAPFFANYSNALEQLTSNHPESVNVLTKDVYQRKKDPPFHHQYYDLLRQEQGDYRTANAQMARALNHARIFESYGRCLEHAQEQAAAAGNDNNSNNNSLETYYDVFMRIRDDVGFENPLPESVLINLLEPSPGSVQVTECRSWYGMNDRFASVAPDVAEVYFTQLYKKYQSRVFPKDRVFNPETYLMSTYVEAGLRILVNRDLKGVLKIVMTKEGSPAYAPSDLDATYCPGVDKYRERLLELYGWNF